MAGVLVGAAGAASASVFAVVLALRVRRGAAGLGAVLGEAGFFLLVGVALGRSASGW